MNADTSAAPTAAPTAGDSLGRAIWLGARPLVWTLMVIGGAIGVVALIPNLVYPLGFLTWRWITLAIWAAGWVIGAVVYIAATRRALQVARAWQSAGNLRQATATHWTLLIAALLLLTPVILALALPQHPAPCRCPSLAPFCPSCLSCRIRYARALGGVFRLLYTGRE